MNASKIRQKCRTRQLMRVCLPLPNIIEECYEVEAYQRKERYDKREGMHSGRDETGERSIKEILQRDKETKRF